MKNGIHISVGVKDATIVGADHRALQAAVDYVAALGGGTIHIQPGTYQMEDSLHLRSHLKLIGNSEQTILRKESGFISPLLTDGDYGEEQVSLVDPTGFEVGSGISIRDDASGGFHTTTATITAQLDQNTFAINKPLQADCMVVRNAIAKKSFPVISVYSAENVEIEGLAIDGNRAANQSLNGCRGAGIFFYRVNNSRISDCVVHDYNGDGYSFQQSNDIVIENCQSYHNSNLGFHPGSGSQRPVIRNNIAYENEGDGLFLCWRVRHGVFEGNELRNNGQYGISIGHKDSDNLLIDNLVLSNASHGIYFRNEPEYTGGHRNRLEANAIYNNGTQEDGNGITIDGETNDVRIVNNRVGNKTEYGLATQRVGIFVGQKAKRIEISENELKDNLDADIVE
jgi:polygalacturonase